MKISGLSMGWVGIALACLGACPTAASESSAQPGGPRDLAIEPATALDTGLSVSRAPQQHGYLSLTRRLVTPPLKPRTTANIT